VWQDDRNRGSNIYLYDLYAKNETKISTIEYAELPDTYGNRIIWGNSFSPETEIYMYDLSTKITINTAGFARIYGNRLVWDDGRKDAPDTDPISDIHMYDLSTKKETQITTSGSAHSPEIYGDRIVWLDSRNGYWNSNIYMYDLSINKETRITTSGSALKPAIYGNRIVWLDSRNGSSNIYMSTISSGETKPKLPVASFSVSPTSGYAPLTVKFADKSTNSPTSWKWSFGDKTYSTQKNPAHTYNKAGKYAVSLTVKNVKGSNTKAVSGYVIVK
jgi:beta propeller repeat protein